MVKASLVSIPEAAFSEAGTGLEAIEHLALGPIDLMILDLNMPEIAFEIKWRVRLPKVEHHVNRFDGHQPLHFRVWQIEKTPVGGNAALPKATVQAAVR